MADKKLALARKIDLVSRTAWSAVEEEDYDNWLLRFACGYTKRSNSVYPVGDGLLPDSKKIQYCQEKYHRRKQDCIFRLSELDSRPDLDHILAGLNYYYHDLANVMYLPQIKIASHTDTSGRLEEISLSDWLKLYTAYAEYSQQYILQMQPLLAKISSQAVFYAYMIDEKFVSCAIGIASQDFFGVFAMITDPKRRLEGFAKALLMHLLTNQFSRETRYAYLQVAQNNLPAISLYRQVGFKTLYTYWYRVLTYSSDLK